MKIKQQARSATRERPKKSIEPVGGSQGAAGVAEMEAIAQRKKVCLYLDVFQFPS